MPSLRFAYAAPPRTALPPEVAQTLSSPKWQVSSCEFEAVEQLSPSPDFVWVDLGQSPEPGYAATVLKRMAHLQEATPGAPFFFISGNPPTPPAHQALVESIYTAFPRPTDVVADLVGAPDIGAAIAKFLAQRKARAGRDGPAANATTTAANPTAALRLPSADLRTERGRLSIKRVADVFGMDVIEIGRLIGRSSKAALSKTPDAESLQEGLQPFADIAALRAPGFGDEEFRKWLRTPNEHMQDRAPLAWRRDGRVRDVGGFVHGILTGQPT